MSGNQQQGNQGGQKQKGQPRKEPVKCPMCPPGQEKIVPEGRTACIECLPTFSIDATLNKGATHWQVVVSTYRNTKQAPCPFVWSVDGSNVVTDTTSDGSLGAEPLGTKIVAVAFSAKKKTARFEVVGSTAEQKELEIPAEPEKKKIDDATPPVQHKITAHLTKGKKGWEILIQTYRNGNQVPASFVWQVTGENLVSEKTADGTDSKEPIGTKVVRVQNSHDLRTATLHMVGAEADIQEVVIPATPKPFKWTQANNRQSPLGNFLRALKGE